jgi:hypothetical protein
MIVPHNLGLVFSPIVVLMEFVRNVMPPINSPSVVLVMDLLLLPTVLLIVLESKFVMLPVFVFYVLLMQTASMVWELTVKQMEVVSIVLLIIPLVLLELVQTMMDLLLVIPPKQSVILQL